MMVETKTATRRPPLWLLSVEADHDAVLTYGVYDGLAKRWDAQRMLEVWAAFLRQWGRAQGRNVRRHQAQTLQQRGADQPGWSSGVEI